MAHTKYYWVHIKSFVFQLHLVPVTEDGVKNAGEVNMTYFKFKGSSGQNSHTILTIEKINIFLVN